MFSKTVKYYRSFFALLFHAFPETKAPVKNLPTDDHTTPVADKKMAQIIQKAINKYRGYSLDINKD